MRLLQSDYWLQQKLESSSDRLSLIGLMVKPVQRFPQFIMLLQASTFPQFLRVLSVDLAYHEKVLSMHTEWPVFACLWSPYVIGQTIYIFILSFVMVALCNRADHYIFIL